ncbi:MAG: hypothetical protein M9944_00115 [Rhizobiaceae bacterium]|nr:hypothetical protein [Rhizobiaceae bacterium]
MSGKLANSLTHADAVKPLHPHTDAVAHESRRQLIVGHGGGIYMCEHACVEQVESLVGHRFVTTGFDGLRLVAIAAEPCGPFITMASSLVPLATVSPLVQRSTLPKGTGTRRSNGWTTSPIGGWKSRELN